MKYSFIFCYRDRPEHLEKTVERLRELFAGDDIEREMIVVQQNDDKKFRRANLLNEGAKVATGDILIFHDVDYYPQNVVYWEHGLDIDVYLPVKRVEFVNMDLTPRDVNDIPGGYRHFKNSVDENFFGGVIAFTREAFFKINGFSWMFKGWGFEDADLRERVHNAHLKVKRSVDNLFYALPHPDSGPSSSDSDFQRNIQLSTETLKHLHNGVNNQPSTVKVLHGPNSYVHIWVWATDFDPPAPPSHIVASSF